MQEPTIERFKVENDDTPYWAVRADERKAQSFYTKAEADEYAGLLRELAHHGHYILTADRPDGNCDGICRLPVVQGESVLWEARSDYMTHAEHIFGRNGNRLPALRRLLDELWLDHGARLQER